MAIHRDAANEGMTRTANLFTIGPCTLAGFLRVQDFTIFCAPCQLRQDGSNNFQIEVTATTGLLYARTRIGGATTYDTGTIPLVLGQWYYVAATLNTAGTVTTLVARPITPAPVRTLWTTTAGAPPGGTFTPTNWHFGNQGVAANFTMAGFRSWSAVLTVEELLAESHALRAVRQLNLRGDYPMESGSLTAAYRDASVYASDLTSLAATPSAVVGPDLPRIRLRPRRRVVEGAAAAAGDAVPQVWMQYRARVA